MVNIKELADQMIEALSESIPLIEAKEYIDYKVYLLSNEEKKELYILLFDGLKEWDEDEQYDIVDYIKVLYTKVIEELKQDERRK